MTVGCSSGFLTQLLASDSRPLGFVKTMEKRILKIYSQVTTCKDGCYGIRNEPNNGVIGRSFYCPFETNNVSLLMVSKNPGIGHFKEKEMYAPLSGEQRVSSHGKYVKSRFRGTNNLITSTYHQNILEWLSIILGVEPTHDAVFRKSAMTAMVKCESLADKTATMPSNTILNCTEKFLFKEIEAIKPKFLLALGREAFKFLTLKNVIVRHGLPIGKLYHPSWTNMKGGVSKYKSVGLVDLKNQYLKACKT